MIKPDTTLVLRPYGNIVEQYSGTPMDYVLMQATDGGRNETRLRDLVTAIDRAADDSRIVRLVIDPTYLRGAGMASLLEIEGAIERFKATGKPVVALADNLGQKQYFLAAMANEVWLNPKGLVWLDGFAAYRQFYAEGLDKLEIDVHLFRAGKYKSAMEPFVRQDMSPEAKEANLHWIGDLWYQYLDSVSRQRAVPAESLGEAVDDFADRLEAADGDFARPIAAADEGTGAAPVLTDEQRAEARRYHRQQCREEVDHRRTDGPHAGRGHLHVGIDEREDSCAVIEGAGNVGDIRPGEQRQHAPEQLDCGADLTAVGRLLRRWAVETPEELVSAVDEVDFHLRNSLKTGREIKILAIMKQVFDIWYWALV